MQRLGFGSARGVLLLFAALVCAGGAALAQDEDLHEAVARLRNDIRQLEETSSVFLEREIDRYLATGAAFEGAQGGGLEAVTLHARFTAIFQGALLKCNDDEGRLDGDVDLDFDFAVTDNLDLFVHLTANTNAGFPPINGRLTTAAGLTDGIGVNGAKPTDPGEVALYEAGYRHVVAVGDTKLYLEAGALDPRTRFSQNAFADDENTQFVDNLFDDSSSILWLTDNTGRVSLGFHAWIELGANRNFVLSAGWFNTPGQWFSHGQAYLQLAWSGEWDGRPVNLRVFGTFDDFFTDASGDGSAGGGVSWDWLAWDRIGVFVRVSATGSDVNPVEFDGSVGGVWTGPFESRPDDQVGVAVGFLSLQDDSPFGPFLEDLEVHVEVYYRAMFEDGKLQITPHLIFVSEPGGGAIRDRSLFIVGLRIFVPF